MRLALAALLSILMAGSPLADGSGAIHVGLVVTGGDALDPVAGSWATKSAVAGGIDQFQISGGSRFSSELVVSPRDAAATSGCRIRTSGAIKGIVPASAAMARYFDEHHYLTPDYVVRYSISSAAAIGSSAEGRCADIADGFAHYALAANSPRSLFLTKRADGALIDSISGTVFTRALPD